MRLVSIDLVDFRSYHQVNLEPAPGLTAIIGPNGEGKTNLIEAIGYLATLSSFRGTPNEALVRHGAETAVVRAVVDQDMQVVDEQRHRMISIESELRLSGRDRVLVNRQALKRTRDLLGSVRVTTFSPDDLRLIKGGPSERRAYLDAVLVSLASRHDALMGDLDRVLRQRNALLKQAGGRLTFEVASTLEVWDSKMSSLGETLGNLRATLVDRLNPLVDETYNQVAARSTKVGLRYDAPWRENGLAKALNEAQKDDLRRGVTTVGPHRDEVTVHLDDFVARTHASQGEQRSLALALRLASHHLVYLDTRTPPILLLDDVFSELDPSRSEALLAHLPPGQALLTTTEDLPAKAIPEKVVRVQAGKIFYDLGGVG
ncbi:MAG: DNA replication/repair protein RecF [Acidimicrobiales bacterium]